MPTRLIGGVGRPLTDGGIPMLAKMTPTTLRNTRDTSMVLCLYIGLYVALDRVSTVQVLPDLGFTLWNPPPACSLALLLSKGLRFAPALFPAAVLADTFNGGFSIGILPTLTVDAMTAIGYSAVAVVLRPIVGPAAG